MNLLLNTYLTNDRYGSTTFPGLTEAMTIDHDAAAAQGEAEELANLLREMAAKLRK